MPNSEPVHVIGATGRSGMALCRAVLEQGRDLVAVVRSMSKWRAGDLAGACRLADLSDDAALARALGDATTIVSCAHARHSAAIIAASGRAARLVLLGSTRRFTKWPDAHCRGVIAGETALLTSGRSGVMLHPTMIYGAQGEDNVQRLSALLSRLPIVPLPGGGRSLVQAIHQDDVTRSLLAALDVSWNGPQTLVIAGPTALPYAEFVRAIARAMKRPDPRILAVPAGVLFALAPFTRFVPGIPTVEIAEIRRLLEDKAFSIDAMTTTLGVRPMSLDQGLSLFL